MYTPDNFTISDGTPDISQLTTEAGTHRGCMAARSAAKQ